MGKQFIFYSLIFVSNSLFAMKSSDPNSFDQELLTTISNIQIKLQEGREGIAFDGGRVGWIYHPGERVYSYGPAGEIGNMSKKISHFDARPIEEVVLCHMHNQLLKIPTYDYSSKSNTYNHQNNSYLRLPPLEKENWHGPVQRNPPSLVLLSLVTLFKKYNAQQVLENSKKTGNDALPKMINYLKYNPKAPSVPINITKEYASLEDRPIYECFSSLNRYLDEYLDEEFKQNDVTSVMGLSRLQIGINAYLTCGADIKLVLTRCILDNPSLFSCDNAASPHILDFADWLLNKQNGWLYLDDLLFDCISEKNQQHFLRCLSLVDHFHMSQQVQKQIEPIFCKLAYAGEINWVTLLIREKLYTQSSLNKALLEAIKNKTDNKFQQKQLSPNHIEVMKLLKNAGANNWDDALGVAGSQLQGGEYFDIINLLLEWGADPNRLFYRDTANQKKCHLERSWYKGTQQLFAVLTSPKRIKDNDEPDDIEYLKDQSLRSIISLFDNGKKVGQENLYNYALQVYKLAFDAYKTHDCQPLRNHIIEHYKKTHPITYWLIRYKLYTPLTFIFKLMQPLHQHSLLISSSLLAGYCAFFSK